jgi:hypothetical protein
MATKVYLCEPSWAEDGDTVVCFTLKEAVSLFRKNDTYDYLEVWERGKGKIDRWEWDQQANNFSTQNVFGNTVPSKLMLRLVANLNAAERPRTTGNASNG